jgi:hypothetical protein
MADQTSPEHEDRRNDLLAMLAAGRELGPDLDTSLVDSYMGRQAAQEKSRQQAVTPQPGLGRPVQWGRYGGLTIAGAIVLAAVGISLAFAFAGNAPHDDHGFWFPWLLFPLIFFVFWGRRGFYRGHRHYTYDTDDGRRVTVHERMRGYGPYGPYGTSGRSDDRPADRTPPPRSDAPRDIEYD